MLTALLTIGLLIAIGTPVTIIGSRIILRLYAPEPGSIAHLKDWLLEDPARTIEEYLIAFHL